MGSLHRREKFLQILLNESNIDNFSVVDREYVVCKLYTDLVFQNSQSRLTALNQMSPPMRLAAATRLLEP